MGDTTPNKCASCDFKDDSLHIAVCNICGHQSYYSQLAKLHYTGVQYSYMIVESTARYADRTDMQTKSRMT